jgi:hypothetical protein
VSFPGEYPAHDPRDADGRRILYRATNDPGDRAFRTCKCSECGCLEVCTPTFDFFVRTSPGPDDGKPLVCERCIGKPAVSR